MTDEEYLIALLNQDEEALDSLMTEYSTLMWAVASKYLTQNIGGHIQHTEELISDVFIRLWKNPKGFDPSRGSLKTYLAMMTRSMALNKIKQSKRFEYDELEDHLINQLSTEETEMDWQVFYEAVMSLSEPTRTIIIKRYFFDMKPKDIQAETGLDAKLIDNKLYQGKKQLVKQFKQLGGEWL